MGLDLPSALVLPAKPWLYLVSVSTAVEDVGFFCPAPRLEPPGTLCPPPNPHHLSALTIAPTASSVVNVLVMAVILSWSVMLSGRPTFQSLAGFHSQGMGAEIPTHQWLHATWIMCQTS